MKRGLRALALASVLALALGARAGEEPRIVRPTSDDLGVEADARIADGVWEVRDANLDGVIHVRTDGVTLDLGGATLDGGAGHATPDAFRGIGIVVENARDVTIKNGRVRGFKVGIRASNAPGLRVLDVDASGNFKQRLGSTPEREDPSDWLWPHHNDEGEWDDRYGAGISLHDCQDAIVSRCRVRGGQNGLLLTRCRSVLVTDNDFSFNSGWGIALFRSRTCEIAHNRCDFCVRGYSHGVYHRGQDSAAILLFEQCSDNLVVKNSATHSGDGLFLYAGHETTQRTGTGGSNSNRVIANDFRFAVANGIEATFSAGNVFAQNDCSGSDHGIWAGYSRHSSFLYNRAHDCLTAGISVEHGHHNAYIGNDIEGARYGLHLWWDDDRDFLGGAYGKAQDCSSSENGVYWNILDGRVAALRLDGDVASHVANNHFPGPSQRVQLLGGAGGVRLEHNAFAGDMVVENRTGRRLEISDTNRPAGVFEVEGDEVARVPGAPPTPRAPPAPPKMPETAGTQDVALPGGLPVGRASMRVDEWGPVDPRHARLFPATQAAAGAEARVHLLGTGPFRVLGVSEGVSVEPREGTAPATLVLRPEGPGPAVRAFELEVAAGGGRHTARGSLQRILWEVDYHVWGPESHPLEQPDAFRAVLAGEPHRVERREALDLPWRAGGPEGLPTDGFATVALASVELAPGRWRLRVVSDDGVRVVVNGKTLIERWDRHGPTEDVAEADLEGEGSHHIRVEHFELDGWAWLSVRLERVDASKPTSAAR